MQVVSIYKVVFTKWPNSKYEKYRSKWPLVFVSFCCWLTLIDLFCQAKVYFQILKGFIKWHRAACDSLFVTILTVLGRSDSELLFSWFPHYCHYSHYFRRKGLKTGTKLVTPLSFVTVWDEFEIWWMCYLFIDGPVSVLLTKI